MGSGFRRGTARYHTFSLEEIGTMMHWQSVGGREFTTASRLGFFSPRVLPRRSCTRGLPEPPCQLHNWSLESCKNFQELR